MVNILLCSAGGLFQKFGRRFLDLLIIEQIYFKVSLNCLIGNNNIEISILLSFKKNDHYLRKLIVEIFEINSSQFLRILPCIDFYYFLNYN